MRMGFVCPCKSRLDLADDPLANTQLYTINVDGSNLTPLPTAPGGDFEPAWSPDGKRIAFTSLRDGHMQIYTLTLAGLAVTRLTNTSMDVLTRQPAWSPFSNQIVYAAKRFGAYQIWSMTDNGQGQQQIERSGPTFWDYLPFWSLDGKNVYFNQRNAGSSFLPWIVSIVYENRDSALPAKANLGPLPIENVHFSPDGFWLIFEGLSDKGNRDIYYETTAGSQRTRLTKDPSDDFDPAWRPLVKP